MKYSIHIFIFIFFALFFSKTENIFGQEVDSLIRILPELQSKEKVDALTRLCWKLRNSDPKESLNYGLEAEKLADSINYKKGLMKSKSFVGVVYRNLGFYSEALQYYLDGLSLAKELNDKEQQGYAMINLGNLFIYQENYDKAIIQLQEAVPISKKTGNKAMQAYVSLNLGRAYLKKNKLPQALMALDNAIDYRSAIGDTAGIAVCYKYKGDIYAHQKNYELASFFYDKTLKIGNKLEDKDLFADLYERMAEVEFAHKNYGLGLKYLNLSLKLAQDINSKPRIKNAYEMLYLIEYKKGNLKKAIKYHVLFTDYKDSIYTDDLSRKIANIEYSAAQKRKQIEIDVLNKDLQLQALQTEKQRTINYALAGGIILVLILAWWLSRIVKERNRANEILEEKNDEIKAQNESLVDLNAELNTQRKQITDSINYAQRIQIALLPDENLENFFEDFFVYLKPRDIVSGDFYWSQPIDEQKIIFAVADCTGHGIPGAFMSMLGISFLQDINRGDALLKPNEILDHLRERIIESLGQKGKTTDNKDGMDIALVFYDKSKREMFYSGAHMPMIIYSEGEITEIKADRMPISFSRNPKPFTLRTIQLKPNDQVYFYSDGIIDQLDEHKHERFKRYRFRIAIEQMAHLPMREQKNKLDKTLENWKGKKGSQTDDIMCLAFRA